MVEKRHYPFMRGFFAVTDYDWWKCLAEERHDDVNFWKPSTRRVHLALGSPFFFKLKAPHRAVGGYGYFAGYSILPEWLAWEIFDKANGVSSRKELQTRLASIRRGARISPSTQIGCLLISEPHFFREDEWVTAPADWPIRTQGGKGYALDSGEGERVWQECLARTSDHRATNGRLGEHAAESTERYGTLQVVRPRLGQSGFRLRVLDAYGFACAVTGEHSLPVVDAAHIKPFADGGTHQISNGVTLRADLHRLFDRGYITFDEQRRLVVSSRLREEFDNGKVYYEMSGRTLAAVDADASSDSSLLWHRTHRYVG